MKKVKQLGIWMDHSNAFLMALENNKIVESIIVSEFTQQAKEKSLDKSEKFANNKEHHQQSSYYKKICGIIRNYQEVLLFGPTDAKNELLNLLKADHLFDQIKIEVKNTDKLTAIQMQAFVKEYFK
jgi:hypothetical protein